METYMLANGRRIPCIGFGCYNAHGKEIENAVRAALEAGYRYLDSAEKYENEPEIGRVIRDLGSERENVFVLSKAWPSSYENVEEAAVRSIRNLQVECLDGYLLHWPGTKESRRLSAYEQLLKLVDRGLVLTHGVSNFTIEQLERLKEEFGAYPALHEIECHPAYQQRELIDWCRERHIQVISYLPINRMRDMTLPVIQQLAQETGRTPAQVVLRWHVQHQQLPIPKSSHEERIRENIQIFDFELSDAEMAALDALETGIRSGFSRDVYPPGS